MLDTHCHLDLYPDPTRTALNAESAGVFVVCVTNLPSAFLAARPHVRKFKRVRLALGLHPLSAELHSENELSQFKELVTKLRSSGRLGSIFPGKAGIEGQAVGILSICLRCSEMEPKFVTIHSAGPRAAVLECLTAGIFASGCLSLVQRKSQEPEYGNNEAIFFDQSVHVVERERSNGNRANSSGKNLNGV